MRVPHTTTISRQIAAKIMLLHNRKGEQSTARSEDRLSTYIHTHMHTCLLTCKYTPEVIGETFGPGSKGCRAQSSRASLELMAASSARSSRNLLRRASLSAFVFASCTLLPWELRARPPRLPAPLRSAPPCFPPSRSSIGAASSSLSSKQKDRANAETSRPRPPS